MIPPCGGRARVELRDDAKSVGQSSLEDEKDKRSGTIPEVWDSVQRELSKSWRLGMKPSHGGSRA